MNIDLIFNAYISKAGFTFNTLLDNNKKLASSVLYVYNNNGSKL